jgi:O-antigen ligase
VKSIKSNNYFFEIALTIVLMIGVLKYAMIALSIPIFVNLTGIATVLLCFSLFGIGIWEWHFSDAYNWYALLILFFLWSLLSVIWGTSIQYAQLKLMGLLISGVVAFIGISNGRFDVDRLFRYILYVSIGGSILYLGATAFWEFLPDYFSIKDSYLYLGKFLGFGTLTIALRGKAYWGWSGRRVDYTVFAMIVIIVALGARGALFFTCLTLLIYWVIELKNGRFHVSVKGARSLLNKVFLSGFGLFLLYLLSVRAEIKPIESLFVRSIDRFQLLYEYVLVNGLENPGSSIGLRYKYWEFILQYQFADIKSFLIGSGLGSFATVYSGIDFERYPHNIFLEVWFELGIVGLIIFVIIFWNAIKRIKAKTQNSVLGFLVFYEVLHLMKSHSLSDLRLLALLLSLCFANYLFNAPNVSGVDSE